MKLNLKQLKLIASVLTIILIAIFVVLGSQVSKNNKKENDSYSNDILNNWSHIVQYNGMIYYQNEYTNKSGEFQSNISRISAKDKNITITDVIDFKKTAISNHNMFFYNNMIYIVYADNTYQYDLEKNDMKFFCQGELQYFDGKKVVFLYANDIYSADYSKTLNAINNVNQISSANMKKMSEDDNYIYYTTPGHKNNTLIVALTKNEFALVTLSDELSKYDEVLQIVPTKNYVYCVATDIDGENYVLKINMKDGKKEKINLNEYQNIYMFMNEDNDTPWFYANMSGDTEKMYIIKNDKIEETHDEVKTDIQRNYDLKDINGVIHLYNKGKDVGQIENPVKDTNMITIDYAYNIGDYLYYKFDIGNVTYDEDEDIENMSSSEGYIYVPMLVRVSNKGGEVQILNK